MPEANIEETVGEDMISELPEDLLVVILGILPTKDAANTMFLSKRWLSIWPMVLTLEYKDSENDDDDNDDSESDDDDNDDYENDDDDNDDYENDDDEEEEECKKSVWWFLDKSMQLHKAPVIDRLYMKLGRRCPIDADVGKWIANAVDRRVFDINFKLLWSADPISLPNSLYFCESLVQLTLSHKILVDVPSPACLPSLRLLDLNCVVYRDDDSLVRFLSGCPILKHLFVKRKKNDNVKKFIVKVPSLLDLGYTNYFLSDNNVEDTGSCLVIDTPTLETLHIFDLSGDTCSIENMPFLERAFVRIKSYPDEKFPSYFSSATSLELWSDAMLVGCSTINFSLLIRLEIQLQESDWLEPLIRLLGNSPKLKEFLVDCKFTPKDLKLSWNQPSYSVPGCLSSQLEVFRWKNYGGREEEEQFLTYILANSKCLKTATISLRPTFSLEEQHLTMEKLKSIPRVSTSSVVHIYD